jgi:acetyltransferase-like isoleucine patch superfamily enzyme
MMWNRLKYYIEGQSTGLGRYIVEQIIFLLFGWIPGLIGIGMRALIYKLILKSDGLAAIENGVRLNQPRNLVLHDGVYLDQGVYLHACPNGIEIGANTLVMHHAVLHVYNFRNMPHSGIRIGEDSLVGEFCVIRGQGGVHIGDKVYLAPLVQILAVNHVYDDPRRAIIEQGITAEGIVIEDDVWIGAGAIILDGVRVGTGSVIGAGSVVTENLPPYSVAAGSPAKVMKDRRERERVQKAVTSEVYHRSLLEV